MAGDLMLSEDYRLFCEQRLTDPYPLFARLREEDPVHWCEPLRMWLVTRYDDVLQGLRDTQRLSTSRESMYSDPLTPENRVRAQPLIEHLSHWLLTVDAPHHTRLRKLVNLAFTPRILEGLVPRIEVIVDALLDELVTLPRTDLIESFCLPLPATVICEMLGIPMEDRDRFRHCVDGLLPFSSAGGPQLNDSIEGARSSLETLISYFDGLIDERRQRPQEDLISEMAAAEADGDRLTKPELFAMCVFLFIAGHETTMGMLASGTLSLLRHPEQLAKFRQDPSGLVATAVEEILRYEAPVTRGVRRAAVDFQWRGQSIAKGQTITMLLGAANRDGQFFDHPDRMDIERHPNKHLTFGFGSHFCLGAQLARIEGHIAFPAMFRRLPHLELEIDQVEYHPAMGIRSIVSLPVRLQSPLPLGEG